MGSLNQPTDYPSFHFPFPSPQSFIYFLLTTILSFPSFLSTLSFLFIMTTPTLMQQDVMFSPSQQQDVMVSPSQQQDVMFSPSQQQDVMFSPSQQQDGSCRQGNKKGHMGEEEKKEE